MCSSNPGLMLEHRKSFPCICQQRQNFNVFIFLIFICFCVFPVCSPLWSFVSCFSISLLHSFVSTFLLYFDRCSVRSLYFRSSLFISFFGSFCSSLQSFIASSVALFVHCFFRLLPLSFVASFDH